MSESTSESSPPSEPFTDSFRSDVILLSSYLARRQSSSSESDDLALFDDISTLLAIGSSEHDDVNAVVGKAVPNALEFLVCIENVKQTKRTLANGIVGENSGQQVFNLIDFTPNVEDGKKLLDRWKLEAHHEIDEIDDTPKYVLNWSIG